MIKNKKTVKTTKNTYDFQRKVIDWILYDGSNSTTHIRPKY